MMGEIRILVVFNAVFVLPLFSRLRQVTGTTHNVVGLMNNTSAATRRSDSSVQQIHNKSK